ncbi:hypothetical protein [Streptomyces sp. NPDC058695]|uniref:hypothetical protein n=1 Tax=Streptomyces sp. NPDC058695 TaxID=3346604 RepID=UPI0036588886
MMEELMALAAAGGTAVVQAAGTDAWPGLRSALAHWNGWGSEPREQAELERLDRTADDLERAEAAEVERVRTRQQAMWQARIAFAFENLSGTERMQAVEELRAMLAQHTTTPVVQHNWVAGSTYVHGGNVPVGDISHGHVVGHTSPGPENDPDDDWPQES